MYRKNIAFKSYYDDGLNDHDKEDIAQTRIIEPLKYQIWRPPFFANMHLTNGECSLRCRFCICQNPRVEERLLEEPYLLDKRLFELLSLNSDDGKFWIKEFHFDGDSSDPLEERSIQKLVQAIDIIKNYSLGPTRRVEVITNGIRLGDRRFLEGLFNIDLINVSLNATTAEEHEFISRRAREYGYFRQILDGIRTINDMKKATDLSGKVRRGPQINVSHVIHPIGTGSLNLSEVESMAQLLAEYGVSKYLFRFDLRGVDARTRIKVEARLEKIQSAFGHDSPFQVHIKPTTETQLHDSCVAQMIWMNMLPNGFFGQGCAHNLNSVTAAEHYEKKVLQPGDLATICHKYCPNFLGCSNMNYHKDRFYNFSGFYTELSEALQIFLTGKDRYGLPVSVGIGTENQGLTAFHKTIEQPLLVTRKGKQLAIIPKNCNGVRNLDGDILFEQIIPVHTLENNNNHENTPGNIIHDILISRKKTKYGYTKGEYYLRDNNNMKISTVEPFTQKQKLPETIKNGADLLASKLKLLSEQTTNLHPISTELLKKLNQLAIQKKGIKTEQDHIHFALRNLVDRLDDHLFQMGFISTPAPSPSFYLPGTLLDFEFFKKYFSTYNPSPDIPERKPNTPFTCEAPMNLGNEFDFGSCFDIFNLNYVFFIKQLLETPPSFFFNEDINTFNYRATIEPVLENISKWTEFIIKFPQEYEGYIEYRPDLYENIFFFILYVNARSLKNPPQINEIKKRPLFREGHEIHDYYEPFYPNNNNRRTQDDKQQRIKEQNKD